MPKRESEGSTCGKRCSSYAEESRRAAGDSHERKVKKKKKKKKKTSTLVGGEASTYRGNSIRPSERQGLGQAISGPETLLEKGLPHRECNALTQLGGSFSWLTSSRGGKGRFRHLEKPFSALTVSWTGGHKYPESFGEVP